jgi:ferric iron reductase protein FhuF
MTAAQDLTRQVLGRLPSDQRAVLRPIAGDTEIAATCIADPSWLAEQIRLRSLIWKIDDDRVLATLWWYSASTVLVTPSLASLVVSGTALSPRLHDLVLHHASSSRLTGSHSTALLGGDVNDLGGELGAMLCAVIAAVADFTGGRQRALWAIATDAIANRLLWAGQAVGRVHDATALAAPLCTAIGLQLPRPGYLDLGQPARRFVRRTSCCLIYRVPGEALCTSCPRRPPAERQALLRAIAEMTDGP